MRAALREWPIRFGGNALSDRPEISFVIPFRGQDWAPGVLAVTECVMAQEDVAAECLVVEQSATPADLSYPSGVRHIHLPHPDDPVGWRKAWAFNVGVREAEAPIVVCHDADILMPAGYAREVLNRMADSACQTVHIQRFLFCLGETDTGRALSAREVPRAAVPERVRQNWQGGTLAVRKSAFEQVGGYDERFVGWGGEDNEFYDRLCTLEGYRFGYVPFVHLWHEPQREKRTPEGEANLKLLRELLNVPAEERIAALVGQAGSACATT